MAPLTTSTLGAALAADSSLWEACRFLLVGFGIVMVALAGLAVCCMALGWVFKGVERRKMAGVKADEVEPFEAEDPAVTVVIAAAVAASLQRPHRIVVATPASGWSLEGRRNHFASHMPGRRNPR